MADPKNPPQQRPARTQPREVEATHVLVRARRGSGFNRSGFRWTAEYTAVSLAEIAAKAAAMSADGARKVEPSELLDAILREPALDARVIGADEAQSYQRSRAAVASGDISPAQLYEMVVAQYGEIEALRGELAKAQERISRAIGDLPPKPGELPEGSRVGRS